MTMIAMMRPKPIAAWKMVHVSAESAWVQQAQPKQTRNAVPMNSAAAILIISSLPAIFISEEIFHVCFSKVCCYKQKADKNS